MQLTVNRKDIYKCVSNEIRNKSIENDKIKDEMEYFIELFGVEKLDFPRTFLDALLGYRNDAVIGIHFFNFSIFCQKILKILCFFIDFFLKIS